MTPQSDEIQDAAALYFGEVMHARLKPMGHRFSYRVMSLLIDLDRLEEADRRSPLFGINRAALYSFHEADHGERDGSSLGAYVRQRAAEQGVDLSGGKVLLLCVEAAFRGQPHGTYKLLFNSIYFGPSKDEIIR